MKQHDKVKIIQFLNIADNSLHTDNYIHVDEPIFQPEPKVILFTDYEPLQIRTQILKLRNRDSVPRRVSIIHPETRLFSVTPWTKGQKIGKKKNGENYIVENKNLENMNTKVPPGMEVSYLIKFQPEAKVDVAFDLIIITEREKFVVPIRGIGCKVMLEFLEKIDYGEVPVKYKVEKPVIIRNVGEKITKWMLKNNSNFLTVSKKEGVLDIGKSEQIICTFCPQKEETYNEELLLIYDEFEAKIKVTGKSKNDNVKLSQDTLNLDKAYITLQSQAFIKIINKSAVPVEFCWKKNPSKEADDERKKIVFDKLEKEEEEEKILNELQYDYEEGQGDRSFDIEDSIDDEEIIKISERNQLKHLNLITRKFEKIKKTLNEDQLFFDHKNFQIEPLQGKIWPDSDMTIGITFKPESAEEYKDICAYCDVTGKDQRLKLKLSGTGMGPKAKPSFYEKNLFDIPITDKFVLPENLVISNVGVIDCKVRIVAPATPCAKQFHFAQTDVCIPPRSERNTGEVSIPITFHAQRLGEFSERFTLKIMESQDEHFITFKGHVMAPFCKFKTDRIDFNDVSLGFEKSEVVTLENDSRVDIDYELRISSDAQDSKEMESVFIIKPNTGRIMRNSKEDIEVTFLPNQERSYDIVILLDFKNIGFEMLTLPVSASCLIPEIELNPPDKLSYDRVFIRKTATKLLKLTNTSSKLYAQYKILPQEEATKNYGEFQVEKDNGEIPHDETVTLKVDLIPKKVGPIKIKMEIVCKAVKSSSNVQSIMLTATSEPPKLAEVNENYNCDFGETEVLKPKTKKISLVNVTPIPAEYTAFMANKDSIFTIKESIGTVEPEGQILLEVEAIPDESQKFEEKMYIKVHEGEYLEFTLKCRGTSSTIICDAFDKGIDFETAFTTVQLEKELEVKNMGRKKQTISWANAMKKDKKPLPGEEVEEQEEIFVIEPKSCLINPKSMVIFKVKAKSMDPKPDYFESWNCNALIEGDNKSDVRATFKIEGNFIVPSLTATKTDLNFDYKYEKDVPIQKITKSFFLTNTAGLEAVFDASVSKPFEIVKPEIKRTESGLVPITIQPQEKIEMEIEFDPSVNKEQKTIKSYTRDVEFKHRGHDHVDKVSLVGSINYPNLDITPQELNFGCILNHTFKKHVLTIINKSVMDVHYEWFLLDEEVEHQAKNNKKAGRPPLNEVFGIVPMKGVLKEGRSENIEVTFHPYHNTSYLSKARCSVEGGPNYDIDLIGQASDIKFSIAVSEYENEYGSKVSEKKYDSGTSAFDIIFGEIPFNKRSKLDMFIKNEGKVPFYFNISNESTAVRYLNISPMMDSIPAEDSKRIQIEIIPGIPDLIENKISINIAHFSTITATVKAVGIHRNFLCDLPRVDPISTEEAEKIQAQIQDRKKQVGNYVQKSVRQGLGGYTALTVSLADVQKKRANELEYNRMMLCQTLETKLTEEAATAIKQGKNAGLNRENLIYSKMEGITVCQYELNFGNVIQGLKPDREIVLWNYGRTNLSCYVDKKEMQNKGFTLHGINDKFVVERESKFVLKITFDSGKQFNKDEPKILRIKLEDKENYEVKLVSNVEVPSLNVLGGYNFIDFGTVFVGRKKIKRFRIENKKNVEVRWHLVSTPPPKRNDENKNETEIFTLSPTSSVLQPGKTATLTATFVPSSQKEYNVNKKIKITYVANEITLNFKGKGSELKLDIQPQKLVIGPVFPYHKYSYGMVELWNPNDSPIEVYSSDFDNQYLEEEKIISVNRIFDKKKIQSIDMPIREAGEPLWQKFVNYFEEHQRREASQLRAKEQALAEGREYKKPDMEDDYDDFDDDFKKPPKIDRKLRENVIVIGPEKSGKTYLYRNQRKDHLRGVVDISTIFEWNKKNGFEETIKKCVVFLEERNEEYEKAVAEKEKMIKEARRKKLKIDETPVDQKQYTLLPKALFQEMLINRLKAKDCTSGAVFDNLESNYVLDEATLIEYLREATHGQKLHVVLFEHARDDDGLHVAKVVDWEQLQKDYKARIMEKNKPPEEKQEDKPQGRSRVRNQVNVQRNNPRNRNNRNGRANTEREKIKHITPLNFTSPKNWTDEEIEEYGKKVEAIKQKVLELNEELDYECPSYLFELMKDEEELAKEAEEREKEEAEKKEEVEEQEKEESKPEKKEEKKEKKEEKAKKGDKNKKEETEEVPEEPLELLTALPIDLKAVELQYCLEKMVENYNFLVPKPIEPDTEELPIPDDEEYQIIKRPTKRNKPQMNKFFKLFSVDNDYREMGDHEILTKVILQDKEEEEKKIREDNEKKGKGKDNKKKPNKKEDIDIVPNKNILEKATRWIIAPNDKVRLMVKYFSEKVGKNVMPLKFEIMTYPPIEYTCSVEGNSEYPCLDKNPNSIIPVTKSGVAGLARSKEIQLCFKHLLIVKEPAVAEYEKYKEQNHRIIKLTNVSRYNLRVRFAFLSSLDSPLVPKDEPTPFRLQSEQVEIPRESFSSISVYAFPTKPIEYKDQLICLIEENPVPLMIDMNCIGEEPKVTVNQSTVEFEKLITGQKSTKTLKIKNESEIECKWKLNGNLESYPEFEFSQIEGVIEPNKETDVKITFHSKEQKKFAFDVLFEVEDNLNYGVKQPAKTLKIAAEAFDISVELVIDNEHKILDFGMIKVKDFMSKQFSLKNLGIYKIKFAFEIEDELWNKLLKFEPMSGEIESGKEKNMLALFLPYENNIEIKPEQTHIKLSIFEPEKNQEHDKIPIFINVASHFTKYTINPHSTINFGSMQFNETSTRSIEIGNDGDFDLKYEIGEFLEKSVMKKLKEDKDAKEAEDARLREQEIKEQLENLSKGSKGNKKKDDKDKKKGKGDDNTLKISQFTIKNYKGEVAPGSVAKIDITFFAEANKFYQTQLAFDIKGRHPTDNPLGIPFDLIAESCIPGIETKEFVQIFEEQTVIDTISPGLFNRYDRMNAKVFGVKEKTFIFGTVIASKNKDGETEMFKIINPFKIPATVQVELKPRTNSKSEGFCFETSKKEVFTISPNECEYVDVTFKPTNVITYSGIFEARVIGGEQNPETGLLRFEMRGEGTLPSIMLHSQLKYGDEGYPELKFPKTRLGKTSEANFSLKNNGIVSATVEFDSLPQDCFSFLSATTAIVSAKNYQQFNIKFNPQKEGIEKAHLAYKTLLNPYEQNKIVLVAEGYSEPLVFEDLPQENKIQFGDVFPFTEQIIEFRAVNTSEEALRFNFLNIYDPVVFIEPSKGFLAPGEEMRISCIFYSEEPAELNEVPLYCETKVIKGEIPKKWNNSMTIVRHVTPSEKEFLEKKAVEDRQKAREAMEIQVNQLAGQKKTDKKKQEKKKEEVYVEKSGEEATEEFYEEIEEPKVELLDKSDKFYLVKLSGTADYAAFECKVKEIRFKPTRMYDVRKVQFSVKNTSKVNLEYNFKFIHPHSRLEDTGPFSISPVEGRISPMSDQVFTLNFAPLEVEERGFTRIMECAMNNLHPEQKELAVVIKGHSERPLCHFEIQGGIKQQGDSTLLQFESVGMNVVNNKKFFVLNPTNQGYEFEWEDADRDGNSIFKCLTPKGVIYSGKKYEMSFEYIPTEIGTHEAVFYFKVPSEDIVHKFLFKGIAREINVLFNVGKLTFDPLLLGGTLKKDIELINDEHIPVKFFFERDSVKNSENGNSLMVSPMAGTIQPNNRIPLKIQFMPQMEKEFNYNLILRIKQRSQPLHLNVKGVGYTINHGVYLDNKPEMRLVSKENHPIDFGHFFINEKREREIILENKGNFHFLYSFRNSGVSYLKISPQKGTVRAKEKIKVKLTLLPLGNINMTNSKVTMQIDYGPCYTFLLKARARVPQVQFVNTELNFGPCYVMRQPTPETGKLIVKNKDTDALTIESDFDNKNTPYMDVLLSAGQVILPTNQSTQSMLEIPVKFIPREYKKYNETVKFVFNNVHEITVKITGEGIPIKLEMENPADQKIDFGIVQMNSFKKHAFKLVNKGKKKISVQLMPENSESFVKKCLSLEGLKAEEEYVIDPKHSIKGEIHFKPDSRIPFFNEDMLVKINGSDIRRLSTISGASYGVDLKIETNITQFGTVVVNSFTTRTMQVKNYGDLPASFKWDLTASDFNKFFTIKPNSGTIQAHESTFFDITLHPKEVMKEIFFQKIKCIVDNHAPLEINLYGRSIDVPQEQKIQDTVETEVRQSKIYEIKLKNPSGTLWRIQPSISSASNTDYFRGSRVFEIPANSEGTYNIAYTPLTMTIEELHKATVFLPLPDGNALVYELSGKATEPQAANLISEKLIAREWKVIKLTIANWLYKKQRFEVYWELDQEANFIFVNGANTIDIGANSEKEYKLSFLSWKPVTTKMRLTFRNVESKEYVFYDLELEVEEAGEMESIVLSGVVREIVQAEITVANPLKEEVTVDKSMIECSNEYVHITPEKINIIPESENKFDVLFRPLLEQEEETMLLIKNEQLGELRYPIMLRGLGSPTPGLLGPVECGLGFEKIFEFSFTSYVIKPTTYTVKVEKFSESMASPIDFIPEQPTLQVQAADDQKGIEVQGSIKYEPYFIGETKAMLTISSPEGGLYKFVMVGKSYAPPPQGPIKISGGKSFNLEFKNPLNEAAEIAVVSINPAFQVGGKVNPKIDAKKTIQIPVTYKPLPDSFNMGTLQVTLNNMPPWTYYLEAE